jgi:hypothetical protein
MVNTSRITRELSIALRMKKPTTQPKAPRNKQTPSADVLWADRQKLVDILGTAPALMVAIVITSYLDASLISLLQQTMSASEFSEIRDTFGARARRLLYEG